MQSGSRSKSEHYQPDLAKLGSLISEKVSQADAVIVSDYGKGFVTNELLSLVRNPPSFWLSIRSLVDYWITLNRTCFTPNRMEALELAGMSRESRGVFPPSGSREHFLIFIHLKCSRSLLGEGMLLAKSGNVERTIPTAAREVFDVSGARYGHCFPDPRLNRWPIF